MMMMDVALQDLTPVSLPVSVSDPVSRLAKAMVGKPTLSPRTITEAGGCFAAGTLVHTKDGLKPIEQIQVGDRVLSKPESGAGEQAYKRVVNTFSFEDKVVRRVSYGLQRDGKYHGDDLIVTPNHPFWVVGVDKLLYPDVSLLDDFKLGWTRADGLFPGVLIELATGEHVTVGSGSLRRLWKTKQPDLAWEAHADDEQGRLISIKDGQGVSIEGFEFHPDFRDDDTFVDRLTDPVWEEKWLYRCKVYNFEVEDFHTYYVGTLGGWVHNTNCYATTVEYLKKNGVLPSIEGQAFFTVGQVNARHNVGVRSCKSTALNVACRYGQTFKTRTARRSVPRDLVRRQARKHLLGRC